MNYLIYCHPYSENSDGNITYDLCKLINNYFGENRCFIAPTFCRGDGIALVNPSDQDKDIHGRTIIDIEKLPDSYFIPENYNLQGCPLVTKELLLSRNCTAIYTEGILGNPLEQKNCVRWICYFPTPCLPTDYFFPWSKTSKFCFWSYPFYYNRDKTHVKLGSSEKSISDYYPPEKDCLFFQIPILDYDFKDLGLEREGSCYMIRKADPSYMRCPGQLWGSDNRPINPNFIHPEDSILLDNLSFEEIIKVFNTTKTFYCYDLYTFYSSIAAMCGCDVIIGTYPQLSEKEWYMRDIILQTGLSYGIENIEKAKKTKCFTKLKIKEKMLDTNKELKKLITETLNFKNHTYNSYFTKSPCISRQIVSPPFLSNSELTVDFWKISFNFYCHDISTDQIILNMNEESLGGPKFTLKNGKIYTEVGNYHYSASSKSIPYSNILTNQIYFIELERVGYHLKGKLMSGSILLSQFNLIFIEYPLQFNNICVCPNFKGLIKNLEISYF